MKSIKISLKDLFDFLNVGKIVDQYYESQENFYIQTPTLELVPILGYIKKEDQLLNITTDKNNKICCGSKHILIDENLCFAKDATQITTIFGKEKIISKESIGKDFVYDISLPDPHLYITPNGMIHHNTTVARALCNELNLSNIIINCSENGNIDTLRTQIRSFASTISLTGNIKCVTKIS